MKRLVVFLALILIISSSAFSQELLESGGWLESLFVKWEPIPDVSSYNVYINGEGIINKKIDDQLIRSYGNYYRADVLGLKTGTYTITVEPKLSDAEGLGVTTGSINVLAHDRTGFAFTNNRVPGAYNLDGTPRSNAVILYITENTKNIVSLDVAGANANPCVGLQEILDGFKKGVDERPLIIRLVGQITDPDYLIKGDIVIENNQFQSSNITIEGVGDDAVADGWGIRVKNAANIEIRNIGLMNSNSDEGDNIGLQQDNEHIWVHNCDFFYGDAGSDSDQAKGDGALDCKKSTYVTFSYNHFWDSGKSNLLGLSEGTTEGLYITYHHNWFDHSDSRHPRVRYYSAHVYNNYYDGNAKYGVGSTLGSSVFVERNYFRNCKYPILTSMQGSDVYDESSGSNDYTDQPTFSKEDGGTIKAYDNIISGARRFVAYGDLAYPNSTVDFDAYLTNSRNETIASTVTSAFGSNTYNNFDTNSSIMYSYIADSPDEARTKVIQYSGRMFGGDFSWAFNNAIDDVAYEVNTALKSALASYETSLVAIQNDGEGGGEDDPIDISGDLVHNFTLSGISSLHFGINGNLSTSKGTVIYDGITLTQCLKIESSTLISFTITTDATLTLVFNDDFSGSIKINGTSYQANTGVLILDLSAGTYEITKADIANLYLMIIDTGNSAPAVSNEISDQLAQLGFGESAIDLTDVFTDADNDLLVLTAESDNLQVLTVSVAEKILTITEVGVGSATIRVTADDGNDGTVSDSFLFAINASPTLDNPIPDQVEIQGFEVTTIDLTGTFSDLNDDELTLIAISDNQEVVTVDITNNATLFITEVGPGTALITVSADDGKGELVSDSFEIAVMQEVLGVETISQNAIRLFPNPVQKTLNILSDGIRIDAVQIYNLLGGLVQRSEGNVGFLDLWHLKAGTYIVTIQSKHGVSRQTIIKQ